MSLAIHPNGDSPPADERPLAVVLQSLRDGPVRATDVARLSDLDRAGARDLASTWPSLDEATRIALVRQMEELAEERVDLNFCRALRPALDDDSPVVRQLAVSALWEETSSDLLQRLLAALDTDESDDVRAEAAKALGRYADLAVAGELAADRADVLRARLFAAATNPELSPVIQRRAIESLGPLGRDVAVREALETAYGSEDQSMQASALFAMGRSQDAYWLDLLLAELASAEAELRFESARACGQLGNEEAVPELAGLADDEDQEVRHAVFTALGQIGGRAAIRLLQQFRDAAEEAGEEADAALLDDALEEAEATTDPFRSEP